MAAQMRHQHPGGRTDADLDRGAIGNQFAGDERADRIDGAPLLLRGRWGRDLGHSDRALDEIIDLRDMHRVVATDANRARVDLRDHQICVARAQLRHDLEIAEIDLAVGIRRRHGHQVDVEVLQSGRQVARTVVADRHVFSHPVVKQLAIDRREIERLQAKALAQAGQVESEQRRAVVYHHLFEFHQAAGQRVEQRERRHVRDRGGDPIARLDLRDRLFGGDQLGAELLAPVRTHLDRSGHGSSPRNSSAAWPHASKPARSRPTRRSGGASLTAAGQTSMLPRVERFGSLV